MITMKLNCTCIYHLYFFAIFYTFTIFYHFLLLRFPKITETKSSGYLDTYYSIFTYSGYFVILDTYYSIFTNSGSSDIVKYMIIFSSITEYTKKLVVLVIIVSSIFSMWWVIILLMKCFLQQSEWFCLLTFFNVTQSDRSKS